MSTLDGLEARLEAMQQTIVNLTPILTEIGNQMTNQLRTAAPMAPGKGALKRSIRLSVQPQQFSISMNDYGAFQNYGVRGAGKKVKYNNQIASKYFNKNKKYQFGTGNYATGAKPWGAYYTGLGPWIGWFDDKGAMEDLTTEITRRLQQQINQAFN